MDICIHFLLDRSLDIELISNNLNVFQHAQKYLPGLSFWYVWAIVFMWSFTSSRELWEDLYTLENITQLRNSSFWLEAKLSHAHFKCYNANWKAIINSLIRSNCCLSSLLENICLWFTPNKKPRIQILFIFIDTHTHTHICLYM